MDGKKIILKKSTWTEKDQWIKLNISKLVPEINAPGKTLPNPESALTGCRPLQRKATWKWFYFWRASNQGVFCVCLCYACLGNINSLRVWSYWYPAPITELLSLSLNDAVYWYWLIYGHYLFLTVNIAHFFEEK